MPFSVNASDNISKWGGTPVAPSPDGIGAPSVVAGGPVASGGIIWTPANGTSGAIYFLLSGSNHYATLMLQNVTSATATGTFTIEASIDNANWQPLLGYAFRQTAYFGGGGPTPISFNSGTNNTYLFSVAGFPWIRMRILTAVLGAGATVTTSYAFLSESQQQPVTNPSIASNIVNAAASDIATVLAPNNPSQNGTSVLGVATYVALGSTALTNDPGSNSSVQTLRTPAIFKTASLINAGNTAVWTPASGKKFRLMRYQLELTENATLAVAAVLTVKFQDATTDFGFQHDIFVAAAAGAVSGEAWRSGWIDIGNGYLSALANNVLNFNISGAANLTAGNFRANVCGTEE